MATKRNEKGQFIKGSAPISPGRPAGVRKKAEEYCAKYNVHPLEFMAKLLADNKASNRDKLTAAQELSNRLYGKPTQHVTQETTVEVKDKITEEVANVLDKLKEK